MGYLGVDKKGYVNKTSLNRFMALSMAMIMAWPVPFIASAAPPPRDGSYDVRAMQATAASGIDSEQLPAGSLVFKSEEVTEKEKFQAGLRQMLQRQETVQFFCNGVEDPLYEWIQDFKQSYPALASQVVVIFPDQEKIVQNAWHVFKERFGERYEKFKESAKGKLRAVFGPLADKRAVGVTMTSALIVGGGNLALTVGQFGVSYALDTSTKLFIFAFVVAGLQSFYNKQWMKYFDLGAAISKGIVNGYNRLLGRVVEAGEMTESVGRAAAVFVFNYGVVSMVSHITAAKQSALITVGFALAGMWDSIWDLFILKQIEKGKIKFKTYKNYVDVRLVGAPAFEFYGYSGMTGSLGILGMMAMAGLSGAIALAAATNEQIPDNIRAARARLLHRLSRLNYSVQVAALAPLRARAVNGAALSPCASLLNPTEPDDLTSFQVVIPLSRAAGE